MGSHEPKSSSHGSVEPKIGVEKPISPKMDGENFMENPMNKWMIWGAFPKTKNPPIFGENHPKTWSSPSLIRHAYPNESLPWLGHHQTM